MGRARAKTFELAGRVGAQKRQVVGADFRSLGFQLVQGPSLVNDILERAAFATSSL